MGRPKRAASSAFCSASASTAPGTTVSTNRLSALPSASRIRRSGARSAKPSAARRFSRAGVGAPDASSPTATGISFCRSGLSSARAATAAMWTASRRGVAYGVTAVSAAHKPADASSAASVCANDSESRASALGGSSSQSSSTRSDRRAVLMPPPRAWPVPRRPTRAVPSGSPAEPGYRGSSQQPNAPSHGCARCRRRARSPRWHPVRRAG